MNEVRQVVLQQIGEQLKKKKEQLAALAAVVFFYKKRISIGTIKKIKKSRMWRLANS